MNSLTVSLQRGKCIGCGYCEQFAPAHFQMHSGDGKTVLLGSYEKKGFHTLRLNDDYDLAELKAAQENCPVKIIKVTILLK